MTDDEIIRAATTPAAEIPMAADDWGEWLPWPFNEIASWIGGWWDRLWEQIDWVWNEISNRLWGLWNAVHDWIRDWVWNGISQLWGWVQGGLDWVRSNLEGWVRWAADRVGDVWGWLQTIGRWIIDSVLNPIWGGIQALWGWFRDRLGDLGGAIGNLFGWIGDRLGDLGATIGAILGRAGEILGAMAQGFWEASLRADETDRKVEESKLATTMTIIGSGGKGLNLIEDFIQERLINPLETYLAKIPGDIAAFFTGLLTNFWTTLQSWVAAGLEWFGNTAWPTIGNALGGLRDFVEEQADNFASLLLGAVTGGSPATPDVALGRARNIFSIGGTAVAGLAAMSVATELMHPLKQLGLGRISALIWDATGYSSITGAIMGILVGANIGTPLRYWANREFRPFLPSEGVLQVLYSRKFIDQGTWWEFMRYHGYDDSLMPMFEEAAWKLPPLPDVEMMYAKKEISEAEFDKFFDRQGIRAEYRDVYHRYIWLDPRLTELVRIAQFYRPPVTPDPRAVEWLNRAGIEPADWADWWFTYKIAKAGYEVIDIPILVGVAKIAVARREQTLYFDAIRRLRRDGFISTERTISLVEEGWTPKPPVEFRRVATELDVEYETKDDVAGAVVSAYTAGVISEADVIAWLTELGMETGRVQLRILRAKLGLIARPRLVPAAGAEEPISFGD